MTQKRSKPKIDRTMPMVHPNAAAIDVGATMHTAAVRADWTPEPVRSFGTFTTDLHRLVNWFKECGVETVVMESTSVYWIPIFELLDARGFSVFLVNARDAKHVPGAQDRRQRRTMATEASFLRSAACQLSAQRPDCRVACIRSPARTSTRIRGLTYSAHAKGVDGDEPPASPRRCRHHRHHRHEDYPRHPRRRT